MSGLVGRFLRRRHYPIPLTLINYPAMLIHVLVLAIYLVRHQTKGHF